MKKIIKVCEYILFLMFLVLIFFTKQKLSIFLTIPVIIIIYFYQKKANIKNYSLFLFIIAFLIRLVSILVLKVEITDDFKTMYDASRSLISGNLDFINSIYFKTYPFQLGLTFYQALLLKIWNNVLILKIMNSIFTSLTIVMIYKISSNLVKESTARIISLSYIFYLYPIYLNSVLTNQHIQALIMLVIIYIMVNKKENIKNYLLISFLLALANFFRTESIILLLGIIVYSLGYINRNNYKTQLLKVGTIILTYLLLTTLTSTIINTSILKPNTDDSQIKSTTLWKFYCGLNDEHNGIYNDEDAGRYFSSSDEKKLLLERIKEEKYKFPILFLKKEVILWTQTNYDLRITNKCDDKLFSLLQLYNQGFLNAVIVLFIISLIPKKKSENDKIIFIKTIIAIYYLIYMFIEISPRYAYNLHMLVFLILGIGLERIINKYKKITS